MRAVARPNGRWWPIELVNARADYVFRWWPIFAGVNLAAFVAVFWLEPAGLDSCEAVPSPDARAVQIAIAGVALAISTAVALRSFRGRLLVAALVPIALATLVWVWLLSAPGSC
jgi:hypothetical protein